MNNINLQFGITFTDLYSNTGLVKIDNLFLNFLQKNNEYIYNLLLEYREQLNFQSEVVLAVSPYVEEFIAKLFNIEQEVISNKESQIILDVIYLCKRDFIKRQVLNKGQYETHNYEHFSDIKNKIECYLEGTYSDLLFSQRIMIWLENKEQYQAEINCAKKFVISSMASFEGKLYHRNSTLFNFPLKINPENLIRNTNKVYKTIEINKDSFINRSGFDLTDHGLNKEQSFDQAKYCLICHNRSKDSCAKGLIAKKSQSFAKHNSGKSLYGCPLKQKISEMSLLKTMGLDIAALTVITIDNPLVAATGHRICNDCMASCIFQKQDPVNVPGIETQILKSVLQMSWGFEIYSLLVRWNPLRLNDIYPKPLSNKSVMIVGMGPSGFTLAHYLMQEGHSVIGLDGIKISHLDESIVNNPIKNISKIWQNLSERTIGGFGGVAEYGITSRWDKNFLTIIRILLQRRSNFKLLSGVRFGSNITIEQSFKELQVSHIALCVGAGKPNIPNLTNNLVKGVRFASDFLMSLQLNGVNQSSSLANLEIELPVVVIGGGLTAIDTATECLAYYPIQVEKFLTFYEKAQQFNDINTIKKSWTNYESLRADRWIKHAKIFREEKERAKKNQEQPNYLQYMNSCGGVSIVYRKSLQESSAYRTNHEELSKALQEGVRFIENMYPIGLENDKENHVTVLQVKQDEGFDKICARTIMIATGTNPNISLFQEYNNIFRVNNGFFNLESENIITTNNPEYSISVWGDSHPKFNGSVVKAMASAKNGYKKISDYLYSCTKGFIEKEYFNMVDWYFNSTIKRTTRLTRNVIEIIIFSPIAVKNFQPGMFYKLQNILPVHLQDKISFDLEGLALTGAWVDKKNNLITLIVLEVGVSSKLCTYFKPEEKICLMGPLGSPTIIKSDEIVCLIGGGLGNAVLFSIAKAFKELGSKVIYIAGYKNEGDIFYKEKIIEYSDRVIWCVESLHSDNKQLIQGNVIDGINVFANNTLFSDYRIEEVDRFITIGSDKMMSAVKNTLYSNNTYTLNPKVEFIASINSPMQCMMKAICAQCLQKHIDPITKQESFVYSCINQDQCMKKVDFEFLTTRLNQNSLQEKLTNTFFNDML